MCRLIPFQVSPRRYLTRIWRKRDWENGKDDVVSDGRDSERDRGWRRNRGSLGP